ncbi:MAG: 50S ribosomal protein L10 [SAR324 cluster bacterium]|nr:50S ribosomal protein L10 [SAR324 cluster bacterium]
MDKISKEAVVQELKTVFSKASSAVLVDYRGMENNKVVELRKQLYDNASKMKVVKNTLAKIAAKDTPFEKITDKFVDTRAIVFSEKDAVAQAKILSTFSKANPALVILGGLLTDKKKTSVLNPDEVKVLAELPPKEELLAKLLYLMQAPASQFVRTLNEVPAKFVRALSAIAESKK